MFEARVVLVVSRPLGAGVAAVAPKSPDELAVGSAWLFGFGVGPGVALTSSGTGAAAGAPEPLEGPEGAGGPAGSLLPNVRLVGDTIDFGMASLARFFRSSSFRTSSSTWIWMRGVVSSCERYNACGMFNRDDRY